MRILHCTLLAALAAVLSFSSCKKGDPTVSRPVLMVTPTLGSSGEAGKQMDFDIDASAVRNIHRITVEVQPAGGSKTSYLDSTITPSKTRVTFAVQFTFPENGLKGDAYNFTFTAYDDNGNTATSEKTLTISGSKPRIVIDAPVTSVGAGQTANFSVTFSDAGSNLRNFQWIERVNGLNDRVLKDSTFAAGTRSITIPFSYTMPSNLQSGEYVVMWLQATNLDNVKTIETKRLTVP